uniref:Uncharacterized protein n=1 Tax=Tanacetum cinerariifolium TaxID=118510 RepID=A0A6L2JST6_TANCI|nr:hypothetical protein [Tanacetum cinerariifolium]
MYQFWFTINKHESSYQLKIGKKRFTLNMEVFREIFQTCPRLPNQEFDELWSNEEIVSFTKELRHKGNIKSITDLKTWNSLAYKTYLAYAIGAATPKKAKNFKKPSSPSKKRTLFIIEEEEQEPAKIVVSSQKSSRKHSVCVGFKDTLGVTASKKKTPTTTDKSKSIDLLFDGDSGDEANVQGNDEDIQDSDDEPQQADAKRTDSENQETNDNDEESDDEFVHTHPNYVPTYDETNDESNDIDEEEYDRIDKELYGNVKVRLTNAEQDNKGKEVADMTDVAHVQMDVKEIKNVDHSSKLISTIKSKVLNAVKEYLGTSPDDALYKVLQKHSADIAKEHSVPAKIIKRLRQQYVP